jgi:hypothetical protein
MRKKRKEIEGRKKRESKMRKDQMGRHICRLTYVNMGRNERERKEKKKEGERREKV